MRRLWFKYDSSGKLKSLRVIDNNGDKSFKMDELKKVEVSNYETKDHIYRTVALFFKTDWHTEVDAFDKPYITDLRCEILNFDDIPEKDLVDDYENLEDFYDQFREALVEV